MSNNIDLSQLNICQCQVSKRKYCHVNVNFLLFLSVSLTRPGGCACPCWWDLQGLIESEIQSPGFFVAERSLLPVGKPRTGTVKNKC